MNTHIWLDAVGHMKAAYFSITHDQVYERGDAAKLWRLSPTTEIAVHTREIELDSGESRISNSLHLLLDGAWASRVPGRFNSIRKRLTLTTLRKGQAWARRYRPERAIP